MRFPQLSEPLTPRDTAEDQQESKSVENGNGLELFVTLHKPFVSGPSDGDQSQGNDVDERMLQGQETRRGIQSAHTQGLDGL